MSDFCSECRCGCKRRSGRPQSKKRCSCHMHWSHVASRPKNSRSQCKRHTLRHGVSPSRSLSTLQMYGIPLNSHLPSSIHSLYWIHSFRMAHISMLQAKMFWLLEAVTPAMTALELLCATEPSLLQTSNCYQSRQLREAETIHGHSGPGEHNIDAH
jgi:hypothetical protein